MRSTAKDPSPPATATPPVVVFQRVFNKGPPATGLRDLFEKVLNDDITCAGSSDTRFIPTGHRSRSLPKAGYPAVKGSSASRWSEATGGNQVGEHGHHRNAEIARPTGNI